MLAAFAQKLRAANLSELQAFTNQIANIDLDIYLSFDPERCLFRELHLKFDEAAKKDKDADAEEMAFDENAMLGKVLVKDDEKHLLKKKEEQYLAEMRAKKKKQKDMTADEIGLMFMMQGVLIDTYIKATKVDIVTRSSFVGTMVRFVENINRHLISEGGFFAILINLGNKKHAVFAFDEEESVFKVNYFESPLLDMIAADDMSANKQMVIKDMMDAADLSEAKAAIEFHGTMQKIAAQYSNNTFKTTASDKSVWLTHFLKLRNPRGNETGTLSQIKFITFLSAHQIYSLPQKSRHKSKRLNKDSGSLAAESLNKASNNPESLGAKSHNLEIDTILNKLHKEKLDEKTYEAVYKQIAVFLNYFTNYTDFIQIINERSSLDSFNRTLFFKFEDALYSLENPES